MEFLRKLILQTKEHLGGLTLSQRLAIGASAGLVVISLFWLVSWAGSTEMVPLFDQSIKPDELAPIRQQLDLSGVKYEVVGDRVFVPADSVLRLQAQLAQSNALPRDISITFDHIIQTSSPFQSRDDQEWRRNIALANELSLRLRHFAGVRDARVFIDKNTKRTIGPSPIVPTASIQVTMEPGRELDKNQVRAMASFVSRAVAGLDIHNVQVTDFTSGRTYSVPKQEDAMAYDDLEDRQKKESYFANQIRELLDNIPGLRVGVRAELDPRATQVTETKHGKPVATKDRSRTFETTEGRQPGEPGIVPNSGSPDAAVALGSRTEETETETTYSAEQDVTRTIFDSPRHRLISLSASVNVPRSFLAAIYKQANGGKDPTDDELDAAVSTKSTLDKIKAQVETLMPRAEEAQSQVAVTWFHDNASLLLGGEPMRAGTTEQVMAYVHAYGSKAGLGMLAVGSLIMMLMMVRRVGEGPVLPGEAPPEPGFLGRRRKGRRKDEGDEMESGDVAVSEAEVSDHLLVGREVDETTLRSQKLVEQVAELVKADPNMAVTVLQRWIDMEKQ